MPRIQLTEIYRAKKGGDATVPVVASTIRPSSEWLFKRLEELAEERKEWIVQRKFKKAAQMRRYRKRLKAKHAKHNDSIQTKATVP